MKKIEGIDKKLSVLVHTLEMFKNTKQEMIKKGVVPDKIKIVEKEIEGIEKEIDKIVTTKLDFSDEQSESPIQNKCNVMEPVLSNSYLCKFPEWFGIDPIMISEIYENQNSYGKTLQVVFKECECGFILPKRLYELQEGQLEFTIVIEVLRPTGKVLYTITYQNCTLCEVNRLTNFSYENQDPIKYKATINFTKCDFCDAIPNILRLSYDRVYNHKTTKVELKSKLVDREGIVYKRDETSY